ncbi:MFS transporter [Dactylosporangium sp. NPDC005555]|uniref:MFS transporter n=1 Tax=Dactylosporangium sp. NPDC005555 TaxID=3154889 RepID=UPI0033BFB723
MIRGNRAYQLFLVATLLSFVGSTVHVLAASWLILSLTGVAYSVPLLLLFSAVPGVLLAPVVGSVVDRFDPRVLLIVVDVISAAAVFSIPLASSADLLVPWHLYAVESILALCGQFYGSASRVFVNRLAAPDELLAANATTTLVYQLGIAFGALGGGLVVATAGPLTGLLVNGVSFLLSGVGMAAIGLTRQWKAATPPAVEPAERTGAWQGFVNTGRLMIGHRRILHMTLLYVGLQSMHRLLSSLLAPYVSAGGHGAGTQGGLQMSYSLGAVLAGGLIPLITRRFGAAAILLIGSVGVAGLAVAFSFTSDWTGILTYGALGLAVSAWIYHLTAAQLLVPAKQQGTYFATTGSLVSLAGIVVFGAGTLLLHTLEPRTVYWIGAAALLATALPSLLATRRAPDPTAAEPGRPALKDPEPDRSQA